jgi:hypothetical protein
MAVDFIDPINRVPLEREYEAWITDAIDRYFLVTRRKVSIFAISPSEEILWPADEVLAAEGKVVGLQFKAPKLSNSSSLAAIDPARMYWSLHSPAHQFELIQRHDEIFYCLPTFTNRRYRHVALQHCLFWRPNDDSKMAWYDNPSPRVRTANTKLAVESRWGYFVEQLLYCNVGRRCTVNNFRKYVDELAVEMKSEVEERPVRRTKGRTSNFKQFILFIELANS